MSQLATASEQTLHRSQFLEIEEVVALLRVSSSLLAKWRMRGRGPRFIKVGRRILYERSELSRWLAAQTHRSTQD